MSNEVSTNNVIDIKIGGIGRKRFRINGDDNMIISLDTSDFNIVTRLEKSYDELQELCSQAVKKLSGAKEEAENFSETAEALSELNDKMKKIINYIFDSDVCSVCVGNAALYDITETGELRFETIIMCLCGLYEDAIKKNSEKMIGRFKAHTAKYTENAKKK